MKPFSLQWEISSCLEGMLVRDVLAQKQISRRTLVSIKFEGGSILLNGENVNVRKVVHEGDVLQVIFPSENRSEGMPADFFPLCIVYEDDYVLVVEKPAGMNTIPSKEHPRESLANGLIAYYVKNDIPSTVHIVTRLDRNTSGLVLIAKNRFVHHLFTLQQNQRQIKRTYEALAEGVFETSSGTIDKPIGRKSTSIIEREVRSDGQTACTHYQVLNQYKEFAHLQLQLETGRTHQIRVHMSYMGHPLVGDDLYGGSTKFLHRQALHCRTLTFFHPIENKFLMFQSPLTPDIAELLFGAKG